MFGRARSAAVWRASTLKLERADPLQDPKVRVLTSRYLSIRSAMHRDDVDAALRLAEILEEGRPRVRGRYLRWLRELGTERTTAGRYVRLREFAMRHARFVADWKDVGLGKMHRLILIDGAGRRQLMTERRRPELRAMFLDRFMALTRPYLVAQSPRRRGARPRSVMRRLRRACDGLRSLPLRRLRNPAEREHFRRELGVARRLIAAWLRRL